MSISRLTTVPAVLLSVALALACGDHTTAPQSAEIHVVLAMTGPAGDPDGASVSLDGAPARPIFAGEHLALEGIPHGSHVLVLGDLAQGCTVGGTNPRFVSVEEGAIEEVRFDVACVDAPTTGDDPAQVLATGGLYPKVTPSDSVLSSSSSREQRDDGPWRCTTERHSAVDAPDDYATFDPNAEVIYPGVMLQGATLVNATPEPIVVPRAGGTVSINLLNGSAGVSQDVTEVKLSTVAQAINNILAQNTGIVPARFTYTSSEVQSREQLALSLGVNVSTLSTDFKSRMSFSTDQQYNRFLVQMVQSYYTVVFDLPESLHDLLAPGVTGQQLDPYVGPGNPATYISSVTYGRRFFLLIESTSSLTEMKASIQASYDAALVNGSLDAGATYVKDLQNVNVKVFALGGDQSLATAMFNGDFDAVKAFLTQGADIRTAVPLSYVVRNVLDNGIVNVKVATDYDVKTCVSMAPDVLYSGFAADAEGWTTYQAGTDVLTWSNAATCGSGMGGCVSWTQWNLMGTQGAFARAPQAWLGGKDWTVFYGGTLDYQNRVPAGSGLSLCGGVWWPARSHVLIQNRSGQSLTVSLPASLLNATRAGWTLIPISIVDTGTVLGADRVKWRYGDHDASEAEMRSVLSQVTDFRIQLAPTCLFPQTFWFDEVSLRGPVAPSSPFRGARRARRM